MRQPHDLVPLGRMRRGDDTVVKLPHSHWQSGLLIFYSFDNCQFPECLAGKILEFSHGSTSLFVEWNVDIDERRRLDSVSMPQRSGGS